MNGLNILPGLKTHLVVLGLIVMAVGAFIHGDIQLSELIHRSLEALGYSTIRLGIAAGVATLAGK